jgi:hypothetical protein
LIQRSHFLVYTSIRRVESVHLGWRSSYIITFGSNNSYRYWARCFTPTLAFELYLDYCCTLLPSRLYLYYSSSNSITVAYFYYSNIIPTTRVVLLSAELYLIPREPYFYQSNYISYHASRTSISRIISLLFEHQLDYCCVSLLFEYQLDYCCVSLLFEYQLYHLSCACVTGLRLDYRCPSRGSTIEP